MHWMLAHACYACAAAPFVVYVTSAGHDSKAALILRTGGPENFTWAPLAPHQSDNGIHTYTCFFQHPAISWSVWFIWFGCTIRHAHVLHWLWRHGGPDVPHYVDGPDVPHWWNFFGRHHQIGGCVDKCVHAMQGSALQQRGLGVAWQKEISRITQLPRHSARVCTRTVPPCHTCVHRSTHVGAVWPIAMWPRANMLKAHPKKRTHP